MTKRIGDRLPEEVVRAFDGEDLERKIGPAYVLMTVDADGVPRPCMLSAGEIVATDDRTLRLALWSGTRTSRNLADGRPALLCYVAPGSVLYIRGTPRPLGGSDETRLDLFELPVDGVESDAHAGMPVTQTITFAVGSRDPAEVARAWRRQLEVLRSA
jgi:hypothetical protein